MSEGPQASSSMVSIMVNPMDEEEVMGLIMVNSMVETALNVRVHGHRTFKKGENDGPWRLSDYEVQVDDIDCVTGTTCVPLIPLADRQMLFEASAQALLPAAQRHLLGSIAAAELFFETADLQKETTETKAEAETAKVAAKAAEVKAARLKKKVTRQQPLVEKYKADEKDRLKGAKKGAKITNAAKARRSKLYKKAILDLIIPTNKWGRIKTKREIARDIATDTSPDRWAELDIDEEYIPTVDTIRSYVNKYYTL